MSLAVNVEVSNEIRTNMRNGNRQQVAYVDTGGKYPEETTLFVGDQGPLPAGEYVATRIRKKGFDFVVDLNQIEPKKK